MGNFRYRFQQWAAGRYGTDELNRFLYFATIACIIISFFGRLWFPLRFFSYLALVMIIFSLYRSFSKNHAARYKEREIYQKAKTKIAGFFRIQKRRWDEKDTHVFYTCPSCKTTIRVPRGHGRIEITCPKCRHKFIKST